MDFSLTEEQQDVRQLASQILGREATPERICGIEESDQGFDDTLWQQLAEAGLLGIAIDEEYGGMGFDFETLCLLIEETGKTVAPVPVVSVLASSAMAIQQFANEAQKQAWLPGIARGEHFVTAALTEIGGDNPAHPHSELTLAGNTWRLNGHKHMVPLADRASRILLTARLGDQLALLLLNPAAIGVSLIPQEVTNAEHQYQVLFDNVHIPAEDIIAKGTDAICAVTSLIQHTLAANSVLTLGVIEKMLTMTAQYTAEREQFGRPIATFQAVSHRAADAFIDVECLRLACEQSVSLLSQRADASEATTIAKIWACDAAHRVSQSAQHLHGGIGVDRDYPLFRYCLWAKQLELTLGGAGSYLCALGDALAEQFKSSAGGTSV
jgi:alkylation response protein AidB-like acyl-CoA dehydrogenase